MKMQEVLELDIKTVPTNDLSEHVKIVNVLLHWKELYERLPALKTDKEGIAHNKSLCEFLKFLYMEFSSEDTSMERSMQMLLKDVGRYTLLDDYKLRADHALKVAYRAWWPTTIYCSKVQTQKNNAHHEGTADNKGAVSGKMNRMPIPSAVTKTQNAS